MNFSDVKKNRNGGKFVSLTNDNGVPVYVQMPSLRTPFGINPPNDKVREYYLSLSLTPDVEKKLSEIDDYVLTYVSENSLALLGKQVDKSTMKDLLYTPIIRPSSDAKYAPTIKIKASMGEGKNLPDVYNSNRETVSIDDIIKGSSVESIIELNQVYFINGKFGVSVRLNQAKIAPVNRLRGYAFIDTESSTNDIDVPEEDAE
jgi:hypothetical protein